MLTDLQRRCVDLSYRHKLTHISSVLNTVNVIGEIYKSRHKDDPFILGNSHAFLALAVVLEKHGLCDAEEMIAKHGTHAARDPENGIYVSGGSLGQAETIAVGMAMADRTRTVWLVTSDGALAEGCIWESLRLAAELALTNLSVHVIANGLGGYGSIDLDSLKRRLDSLRLPDLTMHESATQFPPWLQGLAGHYVAMGQEQFEDFA